MLKSLFLQLIAVLLPYCTESLQPATAPDRTRREIKTRARRHIEHHYAKDLTIEQLAGICYFSEYYFMRFFKKYVGMSWRLLISKTCGSKKLPNSLNRESSSTLSALTSPVGFHNLSYFHREFKKKYGMTPKKFMEDLTVD